jgi:hypothetical protein
MRFSCKLSLLIGAIGGAFLLSGCGVVSSLQFDDRLLVKLPGQSDITQRKAMGWEFRHVAEGPNDPGAPIGEWYLAWNIKEATDSEGKPHFSFPWSRWVYARHHALAVVDASRIAFGDFPTMIEPDFVFDQSVAKADIAPPKPTPSNADSADKPQELRYHKLPSSAWPNPTDKSGALLFAWHLGDDYTQLTSASNEVERHHGDNPIRIGILDDGFSAEQSGVPEQSHLEDSKAGDAMGMLITNGRYSPQAPGSTGASHGTGTIGILAGRKVCLPDGEFKGRKMAPFEGYLGGAPRATIVPVRIAPWVFSVTTANMAYGIDYASRFKKCDVISLSHGGAPCQVWADAVNAAYERGTAMFAAEGDFYSILSEPIQPRGILIPSAPVYPAAFRRVMGVTGVTADGDSYAENRADRLLAHPFEFWSWISRGSYGPDGSWRTAFGMNEKPDKPTVDKQGLLRAYPIAAYSPNIPWLVAPTSEETRTDFVDLDGAGTSAATPQVAAAAALWLDYHRAEFGAKWNTWEKAEAVYTVLLMAAKRDPSKLWPDRYLGAGTLKADDALKLSLEDVENLENHPQLNADGSWALRFSKAPRDFFDGSRSFASLFGLADDDTVYNERADLDQRPEPHSSREEALARVFYNTLLLQQWHAGHLPKGVIVNSTFRQCPALTNEAVKLAHHYLTERSN